MKQLTLMFVILLFSQWMFSQQDKAYNSLWKEVDQLEKEELTTSATAVVQKISDKARAENNSPQLIKALLYASMYDLILEEEAQLRVVNDFRKEIAGAAFPEINVLEGYLAHLYWQYYQGNRHLIYSRAKSTTSADSTDFRTWDVRTLFSKIGQHFENSLHVPEDLQKVPVSDFEPLLQRNTEDKQFEATLFDLLTHTALEFYTSGENSITRPASVFEISDPEILCEADAFIKYKLTTTDTTSLQFRALQLYQELLGFHEQDKSPEAFVDNDIKRLHFIYNNAVFTGKEDRFSEILKISSNQFADHEVSALYKFELAQHYDRLAEDYQPVTNVAHQTKRKEALALCDDVIDTFPKSRAEKKCKALKSRILAEDLQLTVESYLSLNKPSKLLVAYRNLEQLHLFAYRISPEQRSKIEDLYPLSRQHSFIKGLKISKSWEAPLKSEKDYQTHTTEILMPELENGLYVILAETKSQSGSFATGFTQVTDMALLESRSEEEYIFQAIDRNDGRPITNAQLVLNYELDYNGVSNQKTFATDNNGMVEVPLSGAGLTNVRARLKHGAQTAHFGMYYINAKNKITTESASPRTAWLFTDRSIYRPGQPLYFKGIVVVSEKEGPATSVKTPVLITLNDANGQKVMDQLFETNEYGSFNGQFTVPEGGITGMYMLSASSSVVSLSGSTDISVEEYKRPGFQTSFNPILKEHKVGDSISISATAQAYAGAPVSNGKVAYRVRRVVYFPPWYYWIRPSFEGNSQEIAHGETSTDASGNYTIGFRAIPDLSMDPKDLPVFNYEVTADVTDINGETRSASVSVRIGYHSLVGSILVPATLEKNLSGHQLKLRTTNLNDQPVAAKGSVRIFKLVAPENILRKRPWPAPDYKTFTREKFKELFPHEAFVNEADPLHWDRGKLVWEQAFDISGEAELPLGNIKNWPSGRYLIEMLTRDRFGVEVRAEARTAVFGLKDIITPDNQIFTYKTNQEKYAVGDTVEVKLSSAMEKLSVTVMVEKNRKVIRRELIELNGNSKIVRIPVMRDDIGGFSVNYNFSAFNALTSETITIDVPYPDTGIKIETATFRDLMEPGAKETWSFKITGPEGDKLAAEVLAGMYDASLDAFKPHAWNFDPYQRLPYHSYSGFNGNESYGTHYFDSHIDNELIEFPVEYSETLNFFGLNLGYPEGRGTFGPLALMRNQVGVKRNVMNAMDESEALNEVIEYDAPQQKNLESKGTSEGLNETADSSKQERRGPGEMLVRQSFSETAFFYPQLRTDPDGTITFSFTTPDALTRWKLMLLAHSPNLEIGMRTLETVTQKKLMVIPNVPRFLREGDRITLDTKIANLTKERLLGKARLEVKDALSGKDITDQLLNPERPGKKGEASPQNMGEFEVDSMSNTSVSWNLELPEGLQAIQLRITATSGDYSDGEQSMLPVLTNRVLLTETLPMWVGSGQKKTFVLDKLSIQNSPTLKNHLLTLEITSNPAWYAVQALPYLMEYPYDCNEQIFSRWYANSLAGHIVHQSPGMHDVFRQWASSDALESQLEKNKELKSLLIQETPWVRDAMSEEEQKKRIGLLFDLNTMNNSQTAALNQLKGNQMASGAWAWFKGGQPDRFITQHIVTGMGKLNQLGVDKDGMLTQEVVGSAMKYVDSEFVREYELLQKKENKTERNDLSPIQIHYLYMRSFFPDFPANAATQKALRFYEDLVAKSWTGQSLYCKGMIALVLHRSGDRETAVKILRSLRENSINSNELGRYWKENTPSWWWYQAPIETQALMITAFSEISRDTKTVDELKIWLLKNKQTSQWKTTKATADAVYALLTEGSSWLSEKETVGVTLGGEKLNMNAQDGAKPEAGTGYFKTSWAGPQISPDQSKVSLQKTGEGIAWGALYWQYFESLENITAAGGPMTLNKKVFLKKDTDAGELLTEIKEGSNISVGDLLRVRLEIRSDRAVEYVHMKDMRASGLEPIDVISGYHWQDGVGFYESTRDASTHFFFDVLPKGITILEYYLRVNNAGEFSNGIGTIQSMYAPEFSSHSTGIRLSSKSGK